MRRSLGWQISVTIIACTATSAHAADYSAMVVGVGPTHAPVVSMGINASGDVAGYTSNRPTLAFTQMSIATNGGWLGTLPGGSTSLAFGINNSMQVTGYANFPDGNFPEPMHAFLYSQGTMRDLGTLGGTVSLGYAINSSAQITGFSYLAGDTTRHAFVYSNGLMTDLGVLPGTAESSGMAINDAGQVVGESYLVGGYNYHAFSYTNGNMTDLGTLGGPISSATAINNSGQIAGFASLATYARYFPDGTGIGIPIKHAFLYSNDLMSDLGTLGGDNSEANALNNLGLVVGSSEIIPGKWDQHAFLYSDGTMVDLNTLIDPTSGWVLQEATGINDAGQITGNGTFNGEPQAFLLTPTPGGAFDFSAVPEPATLPLLALAALALSRRRRSI